MNTYLSTAIPARIALATVRNLGLSSLRRLVAVVDLVKVDASHSFTSSGTAADEDTWDRTSSSSMRRRSTDVLVACESYKKYRGMRERKKIRFVIYLWSTATGNILLSLMYKHDNDKVRTI